MYLNDTRDGMQKNEGGPVAGHCFDLSLLRLSQSSDALTGLTQGKPADGCRWFNDIMTYHKKDKSLFSSKGLARALHSVAQISMAPACARPSFCLSLFILCFVWAKHIRYGAPHRVLNWFLSMCRYSAPCFLLDPLNSRYERYTTLKSFNFKWLPQDATGNFHNFSQEYSIIYAYYM